jgi:hypothetical protein
MRRLTLLLLFAAACSNQAKPAHWDLKTIAPSQPGEPYSLFRFAGFKSSPDGMPLFPPSGIAWQINEFSVAGDYMFVAADFAGIYRFPKYGGAVATIQEGGNSIYNFVAANDKVVVWDNDNVGPGDSVSGFMESQSVNGGATATLTQHGHGGGLFTGANHFTVDDRNLYYVAEAPHPPAENGLPPFELHRVPLTGGKDQVLITNAAPKSGTPYPATAFDFDFVADRGDAFVVTSYGQEVDLIEAGSTTPRKIVDLTTVKEGVTLTAIDATTLYLGDGTHIYTAPRTGGDLTSIYATTEPKSYVQLAAVDDQNVYLVASSPATGPAAVMFSMPKTGGPLTRISRPLTALLAGPGGFQQDERNLFFVNEGGEMMMLPKTPTGTVSLN